VVKFGGQPIPGATVIASQGERRTLTTTDETGRYEFLDLASGAYWLEVRMFGFQPARRQVQTGAPGSSALEWNLELLPKPAVQATQPGSRNAASARLDAFRNVAEDQSEPPDATAGPPVQNSADGSNEAFLVNGTVSNTLQNGQNDFGLRGPFMEMPGAFGGPPGLNGQPGADGQQQTGPEVREPRAGAAVDRADSAAEVLAEAGLEGAAVVADLAAVAGAVQAARSGPETGSVEMGLISGTERIEGARGSTVKPRSA